MVFEKLFGDQRGLDKAEASFYHEAYKYQLTLITRGLMIDTIEPKENGGKGLAMGQQDQEHQG